MDRVSLETPARPIFLYLKKKNLFPEQVDGMSCKHDVVSRIFCLFVLIAYRTLPTRS